MFYNNKQKKGSSGKRKRWEGGGVGVCVDVEVSCRCVDRRLDNFMVRLVHQDFRNFE